MPRRKWLARQARLPQGLLGEVVALAMSYDTAAVNREAIDHLDLSSDSAVLEVGFGCGRGLLAGVDPSDVMLRHARFRNARYLRGGRMELQSGEASDLAYPDERFDRAFAVHVIYFWPEPLAELRELRRVLRPGGRLLLGFRPKDDSAVVADSNPEIYNMRTMAEVAKLVEEAGFAEARTETGTNRGRSMTWALARRP